MQWKQLQWNYLRTQSSFDDEDKELKIAVCNGIESQEKIQDFLDLLNKIKNSNDLEGLYMERLHEIAQNPKSGKSQLGLYRIAYETEYLLNYEISGKKLIITSLIIWM